MRRIAPTCLIATCLVLGCSTPQPAKPVAPPDKAASAAATIPPPSGKPADVKGVGELVDTFVGLCLNVFPDDEAVAAKATTEGYAPLSDKDLRVFLHDDPGRGWMLRRGDMRFALTLELPPFHSCSVRALLPTEPDIAQPTAVAVGLWGSKQTPVETLAPGASKTVPANGTAQVGYQFPLLGPDKQLVEVVGAYVTHFPNREVVEVRLVRMRGDNPH